jgi:hypothetical protein
MSLVLLSALARWDNFIEEAVNSGNAKAKIDFILAEMRRF